MSANLAADLPLSFRQIYNQYYMADNINLPDMLTFYSWSTQTQINEILLAQNAVNMHKMEKNTKRWKTDYIDDDIKLPSALQKPQTQ